MTGFPHGRAQMAKLTRQMIKPADEKKSASQQRPDSISSPFKLLFMDVAKQKPVQPRKPRDKAKTEQGVTLVQRWVLGRKKSLREIGSKSTGRIPRAEKIGLDQAMSNLPARGPDGGRNRTYAK